MINTSNTEIEAIQDAAKMTTAKPSAAKKKGAKKKASAQPAASKATKSKVAKKTKRKLAEKIKSPKPPKGAKQKVVKSKINKTEKPKKPKLVRDSFTMPQPEYALLAQVKKTCLAAGFDIKKSELLRIGVAQLASMETKKLKAAQAALTPLKAGRPKKSK
ncbi:MAG: hypothetical protein ACKO10_01170 [Betaproteobacteria bacterium]